MTNVSTPLLGKRDVTHFHGPWATPPGRPIPWLTSATHRWASGWALGRFFGMDNRQFCPVRALLGALHALLLPFAFPPALAEGWGDAPYVAPSFEGSGSVGEIVYPEGGAVRVLSLPAGEWRLSGADGGNFRVEAGALRFAARPDFETPGDADRDNRHQVTLHRSGGNPTTIPVTIQVGDRNEPGRAVVRPRHPVVGEIITVNLTDPDHTDHPTSPSVTWQRWLAPGQWNPIPAGSGLRYRPTAADAGRPLRAVVSYGDRHGSNRVVAVSEPVVGPMLRDLAAQVDSARSAAASDDVAMRPAFDPRITHYGIPCAAQDVMTVSFVAPAGVRVSVNGIQPAPGAEGAAAVSVTHTSRATVTVAALDGATTTYTIHCMPSELWAVRTAPDPARPLEGLLALTRGAWAAVMDEHGVSRFHHRAEGNNAGMFLRPFRSGPDLRWAHAGLGPGGGPENRFWTVLDRGFNPLRSVDTAPPLTTTGRHDFRLLEDGSTLLMTYEPSVRDLQGLSFQDRDGQPFGAAVKMEDSAIQLLGPDGAVRWTWNSWDRLPLEDCAQHWFPGDWAHVNSLDWTAQGVLASFRGCSAILMIDPAAPPGEEIVWRLGATNLSLDEWESRGLGPAPLRIVGDPEGEFCGQHAAQLLPPPAGLSLPRLLLFDNGVACVGDPHGGNPLGRESGIYSRAVEYALDLQHGEAVFVRDHALGGRRDMLGHAGGHVTPLPDGDWLVSWGGRGRRSPDQAGGNPPTDGSTQVDPDTGAEGFRILAEGGGQGVRALPVGPFVTMVPPEPLDALLPDGPPAGHGGAGKPVEVAVAFSRPVAAFGPETGSITVSGGALVEAAPLQRFGRPAHAWRLVLAPAGDGPLSLRFRSDVPCSGEAPGICTAAGERLQGVPEPLTVLHTTGGGNP